MNERWNKPTPIDLLLQSLPLAASTQRRSCFYKGMPPSRDQPPALHHCLARKLRLREPRASREVGAQGFRPRSLHFSLHLSPGL